ncbi:uncharacterized protein LOC131233997 isoform X3 [Magnolia sinica]|uniref:uncharacterized protein LOC131233997 isoform X3 n=1 Tax=Magnolia sinica TaxID=86752 RepID=UPI00265B4AB5|nr:uncharacterized protein LOC131233997 isoform X3 [Magnolia sinica]
MLNACVCSTANPLPASIPRTRNPWKSGYFLSLNKPIPSSYRLKSVPVTRVLKEQMETRDTVLIETVEEDAGMKEDGEEEEARGISSNGVAEATPEVGETPKSSSRVSDRDEKRAAEDDVSSDRFKLRNGREVFEEKAYIVGVERKSDGDNSFSTEESLKELAQLADTAGLMVVGSTSQKLSIPNSRTYIGSGKVAEIKSAIHALDVETIIFDDELSAGQLRNLEKAFGGNVRVCDRTALILDIFNQRAATHEAALQVALAQMEYQLPRLTKMWTHLERQAGGRVKGMGEKQIEVDKRILRTQINNGKEFLLTDTVGFIQKLPTTLVAAFRATLEEISESSLLVHVVDISHPLAQQQLDAVDKVLSELDVASIPKLMVWNKVGHRIIAHSLLQVDKASDPHKIKMEAEKRGDIVCMSALNGDGLQDFCNAVQEKLKDSMVWVEALVPYEKGELLNTIHQVGMVQETEYMENGTLVKAYVPLPLARLLTPMRQLCKS